MEKNTYDRKTVCIVILYTHLTYIFAQNSGMDTCYILQRI